MTAEPSSFAITPLPAKRGACQIIFQDLELGLSDLLVDLVRDSHRKQAIEQIGEADPSQYFLSEAARRDIPEAIKLVERLIEHIEQLRLAKRLSTLVWSPIGNYRNLAEYTIPLLNQSKQEKEFPGGNFVTQKAVVPGQISIAPEHVVEHFWSAVSTLTHEAAHAESSVLLYFPSGVTQEEFIRVNVKRALQDEANAIEKEIDSILELSVLLDHEDLHELTQGWEKRLPGSELRDVISNGLGSEERADLYIMVNDGTFGDYRRYWEHYYRAMWLGTQKVASGLSDPSELHQALHNVDLHRLP